MTAESSVVEVHDIVTRFGTQEVHKSLSFSLEPGRVVAIIGGSGAGKSVLLREILGLERPTSGTVKVLGTDMWNGGDEEVRKVRDKMGILFQQGALFSALTAGENVAAPLREKTVLDAETIGKVVDFKLALTGLEPEVAAKMPSQLSGGMRKRVALARALALDPKLLFLDEPTSGLDPIGAKGFDALIRLLRDSLGLTVVMITHDLDTLRNIVDRIIVIGDGRILADGTYEEVSSSEDPWVQEYFSARNGAEEG